MPDTGLCGDRDPNTMILEKCHYPELWELCLQTLPMKGRSGQSPKEGLLASLQRLGVWGRFPREMAISWVQMMTSPKQVEEEVCREQERHS